MQSVLRTLAPPRTATDPSILIRALPEYKRTPRQEFALKTLLRHARMETRDEFGRRAPIRSGYDDEHD